MKTKLLYLLRNARQHISGQELCSHFGVTRTAVWKTVNQLKDQGYVIESIPNKGYRLISSPDILDSWEIGSRILNQSFVKKVYYYDEVDSTNNKIRQLAEDMEGGDPFIVIAEHQSGGKGRRGKSWESPSGTGIWMSLLLKPDMMPGQAVMLTLVAGLAVSEAVREITGAESLIKWPNDIVVNGKKVCGILTEMTAEPDHINYVVIGLGINVNTQAFPDEISTATSLRLETGKNVTRAELTEQILYKFEKYYKIFLETKDMSVLKELYNNNLVNINREVKIIQRDDKFIALSSGINDMGELLITCPDGTKKVINSGEVSVRGIYGYV